MDTITLLALGMIAYWILAAFIFLGIMLAKRDRVNRVAELGVDSTAIITAKRRRTGKFAAYIVTYTFDTQAEDGKNRSFTVEEHVRSRIYQSLTEGMEVTIRYIPSEPATTALLWGRYADDRHETPSILRGMAIMIGIGIFLAVVALVSYPKPETTRNLTTPVALTTYPIHVKDDLVLIQTAVAPYQTEWEKVSDQTVHYVTPAPAGLSSFPYTDVVYGSCSDGGFYLFVAKGLNATRFDAYGYTTEPNDVCRPLDWAFSEKYDLRAGWFWATVIVRDAH